MIIIKGLISVLAREDDIQNDSWVIMIKVIFIAMNMLIDGLIELNL